MQIEHSNEVELIRETLAGDTSAFDQLVKIHRATVYVLVLSYTKNPADAEDVTQRIFIRAYERLATLRELDRFPLWLQQIAHNACKDWLRRRNNSAVNLETVSCAAFMKTPPTPEEIALKREIEVVVREAIGALQETDRKLVEGRYIEGASYDRLQVESGLSYSAIASRLKRAKQQMRRRIEKLLGGMAVLPGRTFIWGGIEAVKLSVKDKTGNGRDCGSARNWWGRVVSHIEIKSGCNDDYRKFIDRGFTSDKPRVGESFHDGWGIGVKV